MESNSGIWAVLHSPYYTLPEGMKFTLVVFSCKQYVDVVAARSSHSMHTVHNIALEPGTCHKILGTPDPGPRVPIFPGKMGTPHHFCFTLPQVLTALCRMVFIRQITSLHACL